MSVSCRVPLLAFLEIDTVLQRASGRDLLDAAASFRDLDAANIAPILCSGGTRCELDYIGRRLRLWHPFVTEDGSAVCIPRGYFARPVPTARPGPLWEMLEFGQPGCRVIDVITRVSNLLGIDVVIRSRAGSEGTLGTFGITQEADRLAMKRSYGEVIQVPGLGEFDVARLMRALRRAHLRCTMRGPNIHVVPDRGGPAAIAALCEVYEQYYPGIAAVAVVDGDASAISIASCDMAAGIGQLGLGGVVAVVKHLARAVRASDQDIPSRSYSIH